MKKIIFLGYQTIVAWFVILVVILETTAFATEQFDRKQVLADAVQIEKLLKKYHPNLHAHRTPKQIKKIWQDAKQKLPGHPKFLDAVILFQRMLAAVCDEHTSVVWSDRWADSKLGITKLFPVGLVDLKGELFLDNKSFEKRATKILGINGRDAEDVIHQLRAISSVDGCQKSESLFSNLVGQSLVTPFLLSYHLSGGSEIYDLEYQDNQTDFVSTKRLNAAYWNRAYGVFPPRSLSGRLGYLTSVGIDTNVNNRQYSSLAENKLLIRTNHEKSVYYIHVPPFSDAKGQIKDFDSSLRKMVKENPSHVIIDLMDNPGGWGKSAQRFLSYFSTTSSRLGRQIRSRIRKAISGQDFLWDTDRRALHVKSTNAFRRARRKNGQYTLKFASKSFGNREYRGDLTILVSPNTRSAATIVATTLMHKMGARIVGDIGNASMKTFCTSAPGSHLTVNTRVRVRIPFACADRETASLKKGNLLFPDIPVEINKYRSSLIKQNILMAAIKALGLQEFRK